MFQKTTAQKKILKLTTRIRIVQGGTSSSKTFSIIPLLINHAVRNPKSEISIVSESIPHLKRGAIKDFIKIMEWTNNYFPQSFNLSNSKYTFINGSYIEFFSVDQPDKLRGARRDILFINEANNISLESYQQLSGRTNKFIYLDYNPTSTFWVHKELIGTPDTSFIKLTYKDNEALNKAIIKQIESAKDKGKDSAYWRNWWKVYGLGEVGSLEGVCIPDWQEIEQVPTQARLLGYGMDFGYSIDSSSLIALYKWDDAYVFDEILYRKQMLNRDISNFLKNNNIDDYIYADSAEPKSIAELNTYGHKVLPVSKGRDSVVYGINLINQNKIYVTRRSKNLIKELGGYIWLEDKQGNTLQKPNPTSGDHAIDAARYILSSILENPNRGEYHIY